MEPRIQYARTSDGVSIAFCTLGEGAPLVCMPQFPLCHIQREWQVDILRHFYERLAQSRRLVLYDARGTGSSDRHVTTLSLDAHILDLEAIVERLQLDQFALIGRENSAPVAISVAAQRPERVSRLVLVSPFARGVDRYGAPVGGALRALRDVDWTILTDTAVHLMLGWDIGEEEGRRLGAFVRECVSRDIFVAIMRASDDFDVTALLADVRAPTLVLSPLSPMPPIELVRDVASRIRDARLVVVERTPGVLMREDLPAVARRADAIEEFLGEGEPSATAGPSPEAGAFRTVLFTDLVGHTQMMSRLGDERGRAVLREHERITREVLKAHGGTEVKTMGDGFMASFGSVTKAVECGIALQRAVDARNTEQGTGNMGEPIEVRCGLNAGEPIEEEGDLFGATVILAARIAARAEGGEILVADTVRGLCSGKGFLFSDRGEFVAKGFEDPVRVFEVRWRED